MDHGGYKEKTFGEHLAAAQEAPDVKIELATVCQGCGNTVDKLYQNDLCRPCLNTVFKRLVPAVIDKIRPANTPMARLAKI